MQVLFRCDAGKEDGLGHVMRCLTLADAMRQRGISVGFCSAMGSGMAGSARIEARGYPCTAAAVPVGTEADVSVLANLPRDVLVVDSRRSTPAYVGALASQGFVAMIDDDGMANVDADVVINNAVDAGPSRYPGREQRRFDLLGPRYNLIDPDLFSVRPQHGKAERLLVTFGGEDPGNHTRWTLERLAAVIETLDVTVIVGPAHPDPASALAAARSVGARIVEAPPTLSRWIIETDVAITAGGTTCYELAAAGVPMVAIAIEPHQRSLIDSLVARGACWSFGTGPEIDADKAGCTLRRLISDADARTHMGAAQRALFAESGAPLVSAGIERAHAGRLRAVQ